MTATYEEVKDLINHPEILLIDVRDPDEIGKIPTSVNIPLALVEKVLAPDFASDEFEKIFSYAKPNLDTQIIFHCKGGGRAQLALESAKSLGYKNVRNYKGSWNDWAAREGI